MGKRSVEYGGYDEVSYPNAGELLQCHPGSMWPRIVIKWNWTSLINKCLLHFAKLKVHFIEFLAVNFARDILVRFQEAAMDNGNV